MLSDLYASWSSSSSDSSSGSNTDSDTSSDISAPAFSPLTPETSFDFDADLEMARQEVQVGVRVHRILVQAPILIQILVLISLLQPFPP